MKSSLPNNPETCPRFMFGRIKRKLIPYTLIIDGQLLCVPRFPAWACDVCHAYMFDPAAMSRLEASLSARQKTKKSPQARHHAAPSSSSAEKPLESF